MGRNRLSTGDRIKKMTNYESLISDLNNKNLIILIKEIKKIRSKTLKSLILFKLNQLDNYNFMVDNSPKEIGNALKIGERKVYDLIRTLNLLGAIGDNSFTNLISEPKKC